MTSKNLSRETLAEIGQIAEELLRYLDLNPAAKDTKEGIANWWISRQRITESVSAVEAALAFLMERGEVSETALADGTKIYARRKPSKN